MDTFNLTWNETLKLNYRTFVHRCRFIKHRREEEIRAMKEAKRNGGK